MREHEVVISGVSGSFPECLGFSELEQGLYNQENMVNDINPRWKTEEVPRKIGKLKKSIKFDDTFFGIHRKLTIVLDPHAKHSFEKTYEAICDAGLNPQDFRGTRTGIVMSSGVNETEGENMLESKHIGHLLLGYSRCMQSNRVSYAFDFKGPSVTLIGSWETGMTAMSMARDLVAKGHVRHCFVGCTNMIFYPQVSSHYQALGKLNRDGKTKSFSADADGYSRSDGIVVMLLQRAEDALRSYGTIVKVQGRTEMDRGSMLRPSGFSRFLGDFYRDLPVQPRDIAYIQADGAASLETDAMELEGLAEVLCRGRDRPLPVTSVKPKMGHSEAASSLVSVAAALVALKTGYVPPVINYSRPNPRVPALGDGRIKIVTEATPLEGEYVGVTSIGLVNGFGHCLIRRNPRTRSDHRRSTDLPEDGIPRLFLLSGRDQQAMVQILKKVEAQPVDPDLYYLNHLLYRQEMPRHLFRGFAFKDGKSNQSQVTAYPGDKRPVWFVFSGMGSQFPGMGDGIMAVPVMRRSIQRCHDILEPKGLDLISIITDPDVSVYNNILHCFVGIAAIQIALVDLLEELGIKADGMVGHSVGELGCSYADKCLTAEQMILAAYARGRASNEATLVKGMMAAVGKGYKEMKNLVPEGVEVACHNSETSCTLSGPADIMEQYVGELKAQGVFARLVNVANIAYHSKNIAPAAPLLYKYLKEIIPDPKPRSSKWISSSAPRQKWETAEARLCSAEYHTNNLLGSVLFEEASRHVPENAVCIEIAPHGLLQAIVKKSLPDCTHIPLTNRSKPGPSFLVQALGLLFTSGVEVNLTKLYPEVKVPVARETDYLHPYVTWSHEDDWPPISLERDLETYQRNTNNKEVELFKNSEELFELSSDHVIGGRTIYPTTCLLRKMMDFMDERLRGTLDFRSYEFQDIIVHQQLALDAKRIDKIKILYQTGSGKFEMAVDEEVVLTGAINPLTAFPTDLIEHNVMTAQERHRTYLATDDVYAFFHEMDCTLRNRFSNIVDITISDKAFVGRVKWTGSPEEYVDAALKLMVLYQSIRQDRLVQVESVQSIVFDPSSMPKTNRELFVFYDGNVGHMSGEGLRIYNVRTGPAPPKPTTSQYRRAGFQPHSAIRTQSEFVEVCLEAARQAAGERCLDVMGDDSSPLFNGAVRSQHFLTRIKAQGEVTVTDWKAAESQPGVRLVVWEGAVPAAVAAAADHPHCLLLQCLDRSQQHALARFKHLTPVLQCDVGAANMILFKKVIDIMSDGNFIQVPRGYALEKPDGRDRGATNKSDFYLFQYNDLSEIPAILQANKLTAHDDRSRFVFVDGKAPGLDPTNKFYRDQLNKDLKVNVAHDGAWGSLADLITDAPLIPHEHISHCQMPLNRIRCNDVDLKVLGINMQNFLTPTAKNEFSVLDYSGVLMSGEETMGVARLTPDNSVRVDPVLRWTKPAAWSHQQAAAVPLFYSMAYYMLDVKTAKPVTKGTRVFVHGGHSAFSQAVIRVALSKGAVVYTTCFTAQQKTFIRQQFPQVEERNIWLLEEESRYSADRIVEESGGRGIDVVVDCLDDDTHRQATILSTANKGVYYFVCHSDSQSRFNIGMSIFMNEIAAMGINPDLVLDMNHEEKALVVGLMREGIEKGVVQPLDHHVIAGTCRRSDAAASIISNSGRRGMAKKVVLNVEKTFGMKQADKAGAVSDNTDRKNYIVIGSYSSLWFNLVKYLASKDANNIFAFIDNDRIPSHTHIRIKSLISRHPSMIIRFLAMDQLNVSDSTPDNALKLFGSTVDTVFYLGKGMEGQLERLDGVIRKYCKESWLVVVGGESGGGAGGGALPARTVHLRLGEDTVKDRSVLNVLDHWFYSQRRQHHHTILVTEQQQDLKRAGSGCEPNILPRSRAELCELGESAAATAGARFKQMTTASPPLEFARGGLDPVFFLPGLRAARVHSLVSRFTYPCFLAVYPRSLGSIDQTAAQLAQELVKFDQRMYNIVAEGWAGPLALRVTSLLETQGRVAAVYLLDAAPDTVADWSRHVPLALASLIQGSDLVELTKRGREAAMTNGSTGEEDLVQRGRDILVDRLRALDGFSEPTDLRSKLHLFTSCLDTLHNHRITTCLNKMCRLPCSIHETDDVEESVLDSDRLLVNLRNLQLLEYPGSAQPQDLATMSCLEIKNLR